MKMRRIALTVACMPILLLAFLATPRLAAEERPFLPVELSGKFTQGAIGKLAMISGKQPWLVTLDSPEHLKTMKVTSTAMEFKGTGRASILRENMYVRLVAKVEPKTGKVLEPIREITWFTPVHETRYGAISTDLNLLPDIRKEGGDAPAARPAPEAAADDGPREFRIVGWIKKLSRGGDITIEFDGGKIEGELAEDAEVHIDINNKDVVYSLIAVGDRLEVKGIYREVGRVFASKVVVHREGIIGEQLAKAKPPVGDGPKDEVKNPVGGIESSFDKENAATAEKPTIRILKIN